MMQVEDGITRAGNGIEHLAADAAVAARMRGGFQTRPELEVGRLGFALVDVGLAGHDGDSVVHEAVDTVGDAFEIAGPEVVDEAGERTVGDTAHVGLRAARARAVAAEPGDGVEHV